MKLHYRPEIDGLRAVAVLPVILFHAGFASFGGGFVGVDVFFVISGYLITSLILKDLAEDRFSFLDFYERRARRILPALFLVLVCTIPFAWQWMMPAELRTFSNTLVSVVLFFSNIRLWQQTGYFDTAADLKPLLHTWSLAVEEQYYIVFPVALLLLWRFGRSRLVWSIALVAAVSFAFSEYGSRAYPAANFFLLPTRAWELMAGALCAFPVLRPAVLRDNALAAAGLAAIAVSVFVYDEATPFPSAYALLPVLGTCLVILFSREGTLVRALLASPALVGIGLISYSAYLWHQPLFAFARIRYMAEPPWPFMLLLSAASLGLAWLTWRFLEMPARRRGAWPLPTRRSAFATLAVAGGLLVGAGFLLHTKGGIMRDLWNLTHPAYAGTSELLETALKQRNFGAGKDGEQHFSDCRFNTETVTPDWMKQMDECRKAYGPGILILGDSHAIDLYGMVASRFDTPFLVGLTQPGCRPHEPKPECQYDALLDALARDQPFGLIVFEQAGFHLMRDAEGRAGRRDMFADLPLDQAVTGITPDPHTIALTHDYLKKLAAFGKVMWFGPRVEPYVRETFLLRNGCSKPFALRPNQVETFMALDTYLKNLAAAGTAVTYVSQIDTLNLRWPADLIDCSAVYFSDEDHYSAAGEKRFGARLPDDFLQR